MSMKTLRNCFLILLFAAALNGSLTAQPQYYNYSGNGNGSNSFPFNVSGGKDVQLLYLSGEFNQPSPAPAGNIVGVSVWLNSALGPVTYTDLTIKLAQSTITALTPGAFYSGSMTTVYYRSSILLSASAGGWLNFTLDTPFPYDPSQSLILDIGQCGGVGTLGGSCAYTTLTGVRRVWSVGGCPFTPYSSSSVYVYNAGITLGASSPPTVITGSATPVAATTATLNGTVNANGNSTDVTFDYGLTASYGTTVPGVPSPVAGNTFTPVSAGLTGLVPGNTYHYRVTGSNTPGTSHGADSMFTTLPAPPTAVTLAATSVTATTATLTGTINAGGASTAVTFEYGPVLPYGTTVAGVPSPVTGNANTSVTASLTGLTTNVLYHFRVVGVNTAGTTYGLDTTFFTSTCPFPGTPGPIAGSDTVCGNSAGNVYSVDSIPYAMSYEWTVPTGAVITAGLNTRTITVTFGNTPGIIEVYGVDTCGNGPIASMPVAVVAAPVPTISGPDSMCVNSGYFNYVTEPGMVGYIWTISSGGTITYGQGTNQVQVLWNSPGAQSVSVNYMGSTGCYAGIPTAFPVTVTPVPDPAGTITGTSAFCAGTSGVAYSVAPVPNASTYVWTLPSGATIASGDLSPSITVDFANDATSGNITVYGNNLCGNGTVSPAFPVTVYPIPVTPVISLSGDTLASDAPAGNQWYMDGTAIPGATGQIHVATQNGVYWCDVTLNGCISDTSNHINVVLIGIDPAPSFRFAIRPVPNNGRFMVTMTVVEEGSFTIQVFNTLGNMVREVKMTRVKGTVEKVIDLRPVPDGVYTVVARNGNTQMVKKIVVTH